MKTNKGQDFVEFVTAVVGHWWSIDREADRVIIAGYAPPPHIANIIKTTTTCTNLQTPHVLAHCFFSYATLLTGYLVKDNEGNRKKLKNSLASLTPARSLSELSSALRHFLALHEHHRLLSPSALSSASQAARAMLC
jgi:hypothetical protein